MLHANERLPAARTRAASIVGGVAAIATAHFLLGMDSTAAQVAHVFLAGLYLAPIVAAAWWFGWRAGTLCAMGTAVVHWVHVEMHWPPYLLLDVTQAVQMSVFVVVAAVVGLRAGPRDAPERRAKRTEHVRAADPRPPRAGDAREVALRGACSLDEGTPCGS